MRSPLFFKRGVGGGITSEAPALGTGTDPVPTATTGRRAPTAPTSPEGPSLTPSFEFRDVNVDRVYVGYWYEGAGPAVALPVALYVWDEAAKKYFLAANGTLTNGQLTYLKCPCPLQPVQGQASMSQPQNGQHCLIIVSDNGSPAGVCSFVAGQDAANF